MNDRSFADTNVLVYLFDADAPAKQERARRLVEAEGIGGQLVLSTQVLQELYVTVTRKLGTPLSPGEALKAVRRFSVLPVVQIDTRMVLEAILMSQSRSVSLWDSLIIQAALSAGCTRLLTEDLQDGWTIRNLTVENPFRDC